MDVRMGRGRVERLGFVALFGVLIATIVGCNAAPQASGATPSGSSEQSPAASQPTADAGFQAYLQALAAAVPPVADRTVRSDQLLADMGIGESLGTDGTAILDLARTAELAAFPATGAASGADGAVANGPGRVGAAPGKPSGPGGIILARAFAAVPATPALPVSLTARDYLAGYTDAVGRPGSGTLQVGPVVDTNTSNEAGRAASVQVSTNVEVVIVASQVTVTVQQDVSTTVTDSAGAPVFDETRTHKIVAAIDVCPTAAGISNGSVENVLTSAANSYPGDPGRVGSHATASASSKSTFAGHVDDSAVLGNVSQDYTHHEEFKRTAAADGGPQAAREGELTFSEAGVNDGVPASRDWSLSLGDHSAATGTVEASGDTTVTTILRMAFSEADDYTTIDSAYVASQKLWRANRCVMVTSPTYGVESELVVTGLPASTQDVAASSSTPFEAGLKHRFQQPLTATIVAELVNGKETLTPSSIPKPPGTLTYTAPAENGKDALVKMTSTSRQGIGTLALLFHTGTDRLKVSINGTMKTSGFGVSYTTKLTMNNLLLEPEPDGTYAGSAPATVEITLGIADCTKPYLEKGTMRLIATRELVPDPSVPARWYVKLDPATTFSGTGTCVGVPIDSFTGGGDQGPVGGFMFVLGDLTFRAEGDEEHILRTKKIGPSTNAMDAMVSGTIVSDPSAP